MLGMTSNYSTGDCCPFPIGVISGRGMIPARSIEPPSPADPRESDLYLAVSPPVLFHEQKKTVDKIENADGTRDEAEDPDRLLLHQGGNR